MRTDNKLKGRDLINIGIYGAIYFVILFAVAMLGMIPIFLPLLSVLCRSSAASRSCCSSRRSRNPA